MAKIIFGSVRISLLFVCGWLCAGGVSADSPKRDIEFAGGLVELGFPDYADKVLKQILMRNPEMESQTKIVQAQILISRGKFDDAKAILTSLPPGDSKAQAIELALAKAYFQRQRMKEASEIYNRFFKKFGNKLPTDPVLLKFYRDSAYTFGQMLEDTGDYKGAANAYKKVLNSNLDDIQMKRSLQAECAKLYLMAAGKANGKERERMLNESEALCTDLQWGGLDVWFGQSISTMAHIKAVRGDPGGAKQTLLDYMDMLKQIDGFLKEQGMPMSMSPMAEARFMLGEIYEQEANQAQGDQQIPPLGKALGEYYNVFVKYGDSDFGPKAGLKAEEIKARLENDHGKEVKIDLGKNKTSAGKQAFKMGDTLFRNKKYSEAIAAYEKMLARYPTSKTSLGALVNLLQAYAHTGNWLMAKTTINYLGERFSDQDLAALGILATGKIYFNKNDEGMYVYAYDSYLDYFPAHDKAGAILYTLAAAFKKKNDQQMANKYYTRLAEDYPNDRYSIKALSNLAWAEYKNQNYEKAIPGFKVYIKSLQPGYDKALAQYCLADSYMKDKKYIPALKSFNTLIGWIKPKDSAYNNSAQAVKENKNLYEKASFFRGYCCAMVKKPEKVIKKLRSMAIKFLQGFLTEFPQSDLAPKAMARLGGIQLEMNQFDEAVKTFDQLAQKYPDSEEGENALFALVRASMEVEKLDIARNALNDMMAKKSSYTVNDFARIGKMMMEAGMYPETIQAYGQVTGATEERILLERALYGTGKSYYELKQYDKAIEKFAELMQRYPNSGLFYDAKFVLADAYKVTGQQDQAIAQLRDIYKFADKAIYREKANLILGQVQLEQGDKMAANASFQRVILLADVNKKELRPIIEKCVFLGLPLSMELGNYQDVQDTCDYYERNFPGNPKVEQIRKLKQVAKRKAAMAE